MSDYAKIKKLDEESLSQLKEGKGPVDECICSLFSSPDKKSLVASVKNAFKSLGKKKDKYESDGVHIGSNVFTTRKEVVKRKTSCGKCGCDDEKIVLKHSYANIRITAPDVSSICPCPSDCLPDKEKFKNNIKVIVEHAAIVSSPHIKDLLENDRVEETK